MNFKRRIFCLVLILLVYSAAAVTPVFVHAVLLRSNPQANAVLAQPPVQKELFFIESAEATLSTIKVFNTGGVEVDVGDVRVDASDQTRMTISLHTIGDGVYTVTWKAVPAIDGHQTTGSFPFVVGNTNPSFLSASQQTTSSNLPISALIAKWVLLACAALLTGQFVFMEFVWYPALKGNKGEVPTSILLPKSLDRLYWIGLWGLCLAFIIGLLAQAGEINGNELAFPWAKETGQVLIGTRLGVGLFYVTRPGAAEDRNVNPIPPNRESVAAGQTVFAVHCAPCHGETGKGDGPLGVVLNPRPADLSLHAVPGVHTDAQLYEWITDRFPGSAMPA